MKLYVDIGNFRTKLVEDNDSFGDVTSLLTDTNTLHASFSNYAQSLAIPEQVVVSNVAGIKIAKIVSDICEKKWAVTPHNLEVSKEFGDVRNGYIQFQQLGIDRWATIIAAWEKFKCNVFVVDCGSAVTVDLVLDNGEHQGGFIIPGNHMMMHVLMSNTSNISTAISDESTELPGRSTAECVSNGTINAVVSFIENKFNTLNLNSDNSFRCIITGGGANGIMDHLTIPYEYEPLLVFEGMKMINEDSS